MNQHSESSSQSGQPEQYKRSGQSERPGQPERPGRPEEPGQPAKSGRPGRSDLSRPSVPTRPPTPSRPTSASHPAVTAATAAATGAAQATEDGDATEEARVILRGPAELADALPYLLGFFPDDSVVLVGLHGQRGRFGSRARLGIPTDRTQWGYVSEQLAGSLVSLGEERRSRPEGIIVYLCQEPARGESGWDVKERLRPLAQMLRVACGALDVPVLDALCISDGRFWSYCCPDFRCCPAAGTPLTPPGTSVMAAAAAYAGIQVRGSLRELESRLAAWTGPRAAGQTTALDAEAHALVPCMIHEDAAAPVRAETLARASDLLRRFREDPPTGSRRARDACDDALLTDAEAARLIVGLQDRVARDRAAEWMEGPDAEPSLRLWQALSRRCVGGYAEYAVAPLSLAGWVAWATGDQPSARVALGRALTLDPEYLFAQLLHRGINQGLDPETLRRCLREERDERADGASASGVVLASKRDSVPVLVDGPAAAPGASPGTARPGETGRGDGSERPAASDGPGGAGRPGGSGRCGGSDRPGGPRGSTRPASRTGTGRGGRRSARPGDRSRP
ncbi:hypothetical protein OEIGOIKO_02081 [Streptomyces chrestomyceticus JCM 4735]|uniref:DUF4192 domain-containing protein n=1 Tax=Streptomyces chrestomyceticus JCM 4735 TaxID=1306181 RepID=A0A7U9KT85_9ACTN|nr:DUF4192 domain-containing protein [Streptomyces chrestomyceticus]GCD34351.1 hypothetical protein OEIGOIKO_02081 [Streptomyces chrestomyceticus JCM 4735]